MAPPALPREHGGGWEMGDTTPDRSSQTVPHLSKVFTGHMSIGQHFQGTQHTHLKPHYV